MKARYALHALAYLARHRERGSLRIAEIAEQNGIPRKFLEAILVELRKDGLLASRKGHAGGYTLNTDPEKVPLGRVIRLVDGPIALAPCASPSGPERCAECVLEGACRFRPVFRSVREETARILDDTMLSDIIGGKAPRKQNAARKPERRTKRRA
jgi:Rrf2 family protein